MPDITVYMNCDTRLAINLRRFNLGENDEFIFAIKNYSYIDSPYVFLFKATAEDIDENGEVLFKITPAESKQIKPGAFYNFSVLLNAYDKRRETEYKKLTENGNINIEYGAQDILVCGDGDDSESEVVSARLEPTTGMPTLEANMFMGEIIGMNLEPLNEK
jgi:hypothetical protein